jgi:hypothetical protein
MSQDFNALKDDVAFLRGLVSASTAAMARQGAVLIAIGVIFGTLNVFYWALAADLIDAPGFWQHVPWIGAVFLLLAAVFVLKKRFAGPTNAAGRAVGAASAGVGFGLSAAIVALIGASIQFQIPLLVPKLFPVVLFTLYGAVWCVAYAVGRHAWFVLVAAGCYAAAIACGFLVLRPEEWLVLAAGLWLLVAVPGYLIYRQSNN